MRTDIELQINSLIPRAEKMARKKVDRTGKGYESRIGVDGREYRHCFWSQYFHEAMNKLTKQHGVRV